MISKIGFRAHFSARVALLCSAIVSLTLASEPIWAHGEDRPGPNGGEIRMPGGFHTEVKVESREVHVYLLDIMFANPTTKDSSVELSVARKNSMPGANEKGDCRATDAAGPPRFICLLKEPVRDGDVLKVKAKRESMQGQVAEYKLPLLQAGSGRAVSKTDVIQKKSGKDDAKPSSMSHDHGHGEGNEEENHHH